MAATDVVVQKGEKAIYEVKVKWNDRGSVLVKRPSFIWIGILL